MKNDDPHISIKVEDVTTSNEVVEKLLQDQRNRINFLTDQKKKIEDILTEQDLINDPVISLKLKTLDASINKAKELVDEFYNSL